MYDPDRHRRRSVRLRDISYAEPGGYFITICTHERACLLGDVVDGAMRLNDFGEIVQECWQAIPAHFPIAELDAFVVMPNHVHGIIGIVGAGMAGPIRGGNASGVGRGMACHAPTTRRFAEPIPNSLWTVVGAFKSAVTRRINEVRGTPGAPVWQRSYWEHVIRNGRDLKRIRRYIAENPARWTEDRYYEGPPPRRSEAWWG